MTRRKDLPDLIAIPSSVLASLEITSWTMKRRSVSSSLLFAILYGGDDFLQRFIIRHAVLHSRNAPTHACRVH